MKHKVRVGVIGCGAIAQRRHLPEYQSRQDVEIFAVCDPNIKRAQEVQELFGAHHAFSELSDMLGQPELDAVSICTPNQYHADMSIAALQARKHVLCEKPMATSLEAARQMVDVARSTGVFLMVGHNQRFMAPHIKAKMILNSGLLGKPLTFATTFGHSGPENWSIDGNKSWFFDRTKAFIGALGDLGVHKIDLISWLLSDTIVEVNAMTGTLEKAIPVDDNAIFIMRTSGGVIGTLAASWTYYPTEVNSTVIQCSEGRILIGVDSKCQVIVEYRDGTRDLHETEQIQSNSEGGQTDSGVIAHFIEGIIRGTGHEIDGAEAMKSIEVMFAGIHSAEQGVTIKLPYTTN
jgi:UDP-N-acetylglucosamine 3-dehydrogenase